LCKEVKLMAVFVMQLFSIFAMVWYESTLNKDIFHDLLYFVFENHTTRGVTRLDGARGKKQFDAPMFEPEVFRKQIYCIEENTCDIVGTCHKYFRAFIQRPSQ